MNLENVLSTFWKSIKSYLDTRDYATKNDLYGLIYPIGSIYLSVNSVDPSTLFGGTWEKIKDRFLLSSGDTYSNGSIGGEASHTLTINEMPSHKHRINQYKSTECGYVLQIQMLILYK